MTNEYAWPVSLANRTTLIAGKSRESLLHRAAVAARVRQPWLDATSPRRSVLAGLWAAVLLFVAGGTLDRLATYRLLPTRTMMIWGVLVALLVGSLVSKVLCDAHQRQRAILTRLQTIADINHHIRNALQIIAYHTRSGCGQSEKVIEEVKAAVTRIEWVLQEVLPQQEQDSQTRSISPGPPNSGSDR